MNETKRVAPESPVSDATLPLGSGKAPTPVAPDRVLPPKYQNGVFLGQGGMGEVYKAFDPTLGRFVALKFLRRDDPELVERFLREARSQARVEHDLVCRVYEVGEAGGRPYIAMQFIEGESLTQAARRMTLEERVKVMTEVAEAIHSAHKIGLIHRDLKPGNILVEKTEDGQWKPHVMDFGLARELEADGMTETGMVMGTPAYMSPEQARGDVHRLDRRTDVYGLGAILYELLTGRAPFDAPGSLEVLMQVAEQEPAAPHRLNPAIPPDLETIVMKCLEKEPQRRYDSARALAEDLQRYREGEPILARRASLARRVAMKARKHRAAVATAAVFSVLLLAAVGLWLRSRWTASERALLAQEFGQQVERIEGVLRQGYLLPLHDTIRERGLVRQRMEAIRAEMKRMGAIGAGPGHYALGRGHLALHELDDARRELEAAWASGDRTPEVALALGETLGALYQGALQEALRMGNPDLRAQRLRQISRDFREPALAYLRGRSAEGAYVEGLIALYERKFPEAREKAARAAAEEPGLYEARKLEGDIAMSEAGEKQERGDDAGALRDLTRAGEAYGAAREIARSDSSLDTAEAGRLLQIGMLQMARGQSPAEVLGRALGAAADALRADSSSVEARNSTSEISWRWADFQVVHGEDPAENLRRAEEAADAAIRADPRNSAAHRNLGLTWISRAQFQMARGADPREALTRAIQGLETADSFSPGEAATLANLGIAYCLKAQVEEDHGGDPRPSLDHGIASFEKAVAANSHFWSAYSNMGNAYDMKRAYESSRGLDAHLSLEASIRCYRKSLEMNPGRASCYGNLGTAYVGEAQDELDRGHDPRPLLEQARQNLRRAMELNTSDPLAAGDLGLTYNTEADYEIASGRDPRAALEQAAASFRRALAMDPTLAPVHWYLAEAARLQALSDLLGGRDPEPALRQAREKVSSALRLQPADSQTLLYRAGIEVLAVRAAVERGRRSSPDFARALEACRAVQKANPQSAEAYLREAELFRWEAAGLARSRRDSGPAIQAGLAAAEKSLAIHPGFPPSLAARGALLLLRAESASGAEDRKKDFADARDSLQQAHAANPLLSREYGELLKEASR